MATSGSVDFSVSRDNIITEALQILGVLGEGESANATQLSDSARKLNMMVKAWQAEGLPLWAVSTGVLFPEANKSSYSIGPTGDHATLSYVKTELSVAAAASDTTIDVDDITGISNSDYIGVVLDDGASHWTTVNGAPSGSTVTLTDAMPSAAAIDKEVYAYTTKLNRPVKFLHMWRETDAGAVVPIALLGRQAYDYLTNRSTSDGEVVEAFYDSTLTNGTLQVWPEPDTMTTLLKFRFQRSFEDFDAAGDTPDFPQEWYLALSYGLASLLAPNYGVSPSERRLLLQEASMYKEAQWNFSQEMGSLIFQPDRTGR